MTAKMYYEKDADLKHLAGKTVAIIGYGSQGHAQALNLRDSGVKVIVSELPDTVNARLAKEHGFTPVSADEAAKKGDIIQMLIPDTAQAAVYRSAVLPNLTAGKAIMFSHGFNIHFSCIEPPKNVDVFMIAPKGPGHLVRSEFEKGAGVPCLVAIEQNATGKALDIALAYAKGIGGTRAGVIQTTFKEETETDLFGEQVCLCGGASELVKAAFNTLVEAGYQEEIAYFECMHELKLIVDLFYQGGLSWMRYSVSDTAEYGDYSRGSRVITPQVKDAMRKILTEIQDGSFAREWILENQAGAPVLKRKRILERQERIEEVGSRLRKNMPFVKPKEPPE
jgi:ketol-acid reductoisomerase